MNIERVLILLLLAALIGVILMNRLSDGGAPKSADGEKGENTAGEAAIPATPSTLEVIHARKSVRQFTDEPVSKETLDHLLRAGMAAPSAVNKQPWAFVAITERATLDALGEKLPYAKMLHEATAAIVVLGDLDRALAGGEQAYWIQDCSAVTQNILLAAEALGLGAVWTGVHPVTEREQIVRDVLGIPMNQIPLNVIPIGHPKGQTVAKKKYDPARIHWQRW